MAIHAHKTWDRGTLYEAQKIQAVYTREVFNVHHPIVSSHCFKAGSLHLDSFHKLNIKQFLGFPLENLVSSIHL